jgi:hypothetical protein
MELVLAFTVSPAKELSNKNAVAISKPHGVGQRRSLIVALGAACFAIPWTFRSDLPLALAPLSQRPDQG